MKPLPINTIVLYPRPHVDTICAVFLLKTFGEKHFPGIAEAKMEYWSQIPDDTTVEELEKKGYLLIDLGGSRFDHHTDDHKGRKETASTMIASYLGIADDPSLKRLLQFAKRDDLEGKGIISKDAIDKAFGLPAIIMNLNRDYPDHPDYVVDIASRIFLAHYHEQYRRHVLMPKEWEELKASGKASVSLISAADRKLRVVFVESDSPTLVGWLRAVKDVSADVVVQRRSTGHTNVITKQQKPRLRLQKMIGLLRAAEALKRGVKLATDNTSLLEQPGRIDEVPCWYYDTAANTLQNGGVATDGVEPTQLSLVNVQKIVEKTLPESIPHRKPIQALG